MRIYTTVMQAVQQPQQVFCDCCGREIDKTKEDFLQIEKSWGYFSKHDGETHQLDICEDCYIAWTASFAHKPTG